MKVMILKGVAGARFSYSRGVHDIPEDLAKSLIKHGSAEALPKTERATRGKREKAVTNELDETSQDR